MFALLDVLLIAVVLVAAGRVARSSRVRLVLRRCFGRALPGACTGSPEPPARPRPESARLQWTEVVNLTAASTATRPGATSAREKARSRDTADTAGTR